MPKHYYPIHLLHTPPYTFPFGKDKEHLFNNRSILSWQTFPLFMNDSAVLLYTKEKLNAKGFIKEIISEIISFYFFVWQ